MVIMMDKALLDGLSHNEKRLLLALAERGGSASAADLVAEGAFSVEVEAMSAASWLESKGLASISEKTARVSPRGSPSRSSAGTVDPCPCRTWRPPCLPAWAR